MAEQYLLIACIVGVHGINGVVKVKSFSEALEGLECYEQLYDKNNNIYRIVSCKNTTKNLLIRFENITNRTEAENLKGTELYIKESQLPALEEEEFYYKDLMNLEVKYNNIFYGKIIAIQNFGAGTLLEIKKNDEESSFIPFKKQFIGTVNLKEKTIILEAEALNLIDM